MAVDQEYSEMLSGSINFLFSLFLLFHHSGSDLNT